MLAQHPQQAPNREQCEGQRVTALPPDDRGEDESPRQAAIRNSSRKPARRKHEITATAVTAGNPHRIDIARLIASAATQRQRKRSARAATASQESGNHAPASIAPKCWVCEAKNGP